MSGPTSVYHAADKENFTPNQVFGGSPSFMGKSIRKVELEDEEDALAGFLSPPRPVAPGCSNGSGGGGGGGSGNGSGTPIATSRFIGGISNPTKLALTPKPLQEQRLDSNIMKDASVGEEEMAVADDKEDLEYREQAHSGAGGGEAVHLVDDGEDGIDHELSPEDEKAMHDLSHEELIDMIKELKRRSIENALDAQAWHAQASQIKRQGHSLYEQFVSKCHRLQRTSQQLKDCRDREQQLAKQVEMVTLQRNESDQRFTEQQDRFKRNFQHYGQLKSSLDQLTAKHDALQSDHAAAQADIEQYRVDQTRLNKQVAELESKLASTQIQQQQPQTPAQPQQAAVTSDALAIRCEMLRSHVTTLEDQVSKQKAQMLAKDQQIAALHRQSQQQDTINSQQVRSLQDDVESLQQRLTEQESSWQARLEVVQSQLASQLEGHQAAAAADAEQLANKLADLEELANVLQPARIQELESELEAAVNRADRSSGNIHQLHQQCQTLQSNNSTLSLQVKNLENDLLMLYKKHKEDVYALDQQYQRENYKTRYEEQAEQTRQLKNTIRQLSVYLLAANGGPSSGGLEDEESSLPGSWAEKQVSRIHEYMSMLTGLSKRLQKALRDALVRERQLKSAASFLREQLVSVRATAATYQEQLTLTKLQLQSRETELEHAHQQLVTWQNFAADAVADSLARHVVDMEVATQHADNNQKLAVSLAVRELSEAHELSINRLTQAHSEQMRTQLQLHEELHAQYDASREMNDFLEQELKIKEEQLEEMAAQVHATHQAGQNQLAHQLEQHTLELQQLHGEWIVAEMEAVKQKEIVECSYEAALVAQESHFLELLHHQCDIASDDNSQLEFGWATYVAQSQSDAASRLAQLELDSAQRIAQLESDSMDRMSQLERELSDRLNELQSSTSARAEELTSQLDASQLALQHISDELHIAQQRISTQHQDQVSIVSGLADALEYMRNKLRDTAQQSRRSLAKLDEAEKCIREQARVVAEMTQQAEVIREEAEVAKKHSAEFNEERYVQLRTHYQTQLQQILVSHREEITFFEQDCEALEEELEHVRARLSDEEAAHFTLDNDYRTAHQRVSRYSSELEYQRRLLQSTQLKMETALEEARIRFDEEHAKIRGHTMSIEARKEQLEQENDVMRDQQYVMQHQLELARVSHRELLLQLEHFMLGGGRVGGGGSMEGGEGKDLLSLQRQSMVLKRKCQLLKEQLATVTEQLATLKRENSEQEDAYRDQIRHLKAHSWSTSEKLRQSDGARQMLDMQLQRITQLLQQDILSSSSSSESNNSSNGPYPLVADILLFIEQSSNCTSSADIEPFVLPANADLGDNDYDAEL